MLQSSLFSYHRLAVNYQLSRYRFWSLNLLPTFGGKDLDFHHRERETEIPELFRSFDSQEEDEDGSDTLGYYFERNQRIDNCKWLMGKLNESQMRC
jgi:hypothetical protein